MLKIGNLVSSSDNNQRLASKLGELVNYDKNKVKLINSNEKISKNIIKLS